MPKQRLAISIRNIAAKVRQLNVETAEENDALSDASTMLRTLAAILDGKPLAKAFGSPGDWGWDTEVGKAVHELHCLPTITLPKARDVGRFGDMSPTDHLRVGLDSDNDVYVSVAGESGHGSVEFCTGSNGGGSSMRTRDALINLMLAIEADNAERPDKDWWARRAQAVGQVT
jgi:hypothetical protein